MCGIAGFIGNPNIEKDSIESCLASLRHRGPDAEGVISLMPAIRTSHYYRQG